MRSSESAAQPTAPHCTSKPVGASEGTRPYCTQWQLAMLTVCCGWCRRFLSDLRRGRRRWWRTRSLCSHRQASPGLQLAEDGRQLGAHLFALLAPRPQPPVAAHRGPPALLARRLPPAVEAEGRASAVPALRSAPAVLADGDTRALPATGLLPAVGAERGPPALLTRRSPPAVGAQEGATAIPALGLEATVAAQ